MAGRSIKIFLVDGSPNGLRTAEIGLSSVMAMVVPRASLHDFVKTRTESRKTGVYVLSGDSLDGSGRQAIYVGEADEIGTRLIAHDQDEGKDFWDRAIIFITKDLSLTKAHSRHIEARLIEIAHELKRVRVVNATRPVGGVLPESDVSDMSQMIEQIELLSSTLGLPAFEPVPFVSDAGLNSELLREAESTKVDDRLFTLKGQGYSATCRVSQGKFNVQSGSLARKQEADSLPSSARNERAVLLRDGVLVPSEDGFIFTQSYPFDSATKAAQVVCGFPINGRANWLDSDTEKTYGKWLDELAVDVETGAPPSN